jgi:hypothetical protein
MLSETSTLQQNGSSICNLHNTSKTKAAKYRKYSTLDEPEDTDL